MDQSLGLLERASAATLERIRADRRKVPAQVRPILEYLEENLFEPGVDVQSLLRACAIRSRATLTLFTGTVGSPPYQYIQDRRMEVACRLLRGSSLKIWQIGNLLGYSSIQVFSSAFRRWAGMPATAYRRRARTEGAPDAKAIPEAPRAPAMLTERSVELDRQLATEVWKALQGMSWDQRSAVVRERIRFKTPALFGLLCTNAKVLGRNGRERSIRWARLACESVDGIDPHQIGANEREWLRALGLANLGNSYALAFRPREAAAALERALARAPSPAEDPLIHGSCLLMKAASLVRRWMYADGHQIVEHAIAWVEDQPARKTALNQFGGTCDLEDALAMRGMLYWGVHSGEKSYVNLLAAFELATANRNGYAAAGAARCLAEHHLERGELRHGKTHLATACGIKMRDCLSRGSGRWLQGRFALAEGDSALAVSRLRDSIHLFEHGKDKPRAAAAAVDLAEGLLLAGQRSEAVTTLQAAIPMLSRNGNTRSLQRARQLLS